jgi:hypothetical protein
MTDARALRAGVYALVRTEADTPIQLERASVFSLATKPADDILLEEARVIALVRDTDALISLARAGVYALVRRNPEEQLLRAWRFPQDDHEFYVVQLFDRTLVYDKLTSQWSQWKSPDLSYWQGADGCDWESINVCCDVLDGKVWHIDPVGRLDYGTTPIESLIVGHLTERFRQNVPCYMAEVAVSEGDPPVGIDATTVGIGLRTSDDGGQSWYNHGIIPGEAIGEDITVRWYGLGLMSAPGRVFEITDTGYARRIDGLNVEVGNYGS